MLAAKPEQPSVTDADYVNSSSRFPSVADYAKQETVVTTDYAKQDVKPKYLPSYDSPISRLVISVYPETYSGISVRMETHLMQVYHDYMYCLQYFLGYAYYHVQYFLKCSLHIY